MKKMNIFVTILFALFLTSFTFISQGNAQGNCEELKELVQTNTKITGRDLINLGYTDKQVLVVCLYLGMDNIASRRLIQDLIKHIEIQQQLVPYVNYGPFFQDEINEFYNQICG